LEAFSALYKEADRQIVALQASYPEAKFINLRDYLHPPQKHFWDLVHVYDEANMVLAERLYRDTRKMIDDLLKVQGPAGRLLKEGVETSRDGADRGVCGTPAVVAQALSLSPRHSLEKGLWGGPPEPEPAPWPASVPTLLRAGKPARGPAAAQGGPPHKPPFHPALCVSDAWLLVPRLLFVFPQPARQGAT